MTIRRDLDQSPRPDDDQPPGDAGRQSRSGRHNEVVSSSGQAVDERHMLLDFAGRVLSAPGALIQALIFVGVMVALVLAAAGLLGVRVDVGPVHVGPAVGTSGV